MKHQINVELIKNNLITAAHLVLQQLTLNDDQSSNTQDRDYMSRTNNLSEVSLRHAIARLIVRRSLPFTTIEWADLHALFLLVNPDIGNLLFFSRRTLVSDIKSCWEAERLKIKDDLLSARTKIHISLDIWTSPNTYLFLGIIVHYIRLNENHQKTSLLALREIGGHAGEEQWAVLRTVLEEYGIIERLGCIIGDSASTNGTLCRTIHKFFSTELFMEWNYQTNQIRCIGHIINLIVQAFLFGQLEEEELKAYDEDERQGFQPNLEVQQQRVRQQMSSLGKLHNIIIHIRGSAIRTKSFTDEAGERIPLDNRTRRNSWYNMLERSLKHEKSIDFYLKNQPDLKLDLLKAKDWAMLRTISEFLGRFKSHTKQLESEGDDISQVLPHLLHVRLWFNASKQNIARKDGQPTSRTTVEERDFLLRIQNAETAWQKWWDLLWQNTTYLLATLLNPTYRTRWFKEGLRALALDPKTIQEGLNRTKTAWLQWHQQKLEDDRIARLTEVSIQPKKRRTTYHRTRAETLYELNSRLFGDWSSNDISEYEEYLNQPATQLSYDEAKSFKPLAWWCEPSIQIKWPHLSSLAISVLSFPAMSAEPERVFSGGRRTISWERSQLLPETIEVLECLKHRLRTKE
jgi:hypothetical protein